MRIEGIHTTRVSFITFMVIGECICEHTQCGNHKLQHSLSSPNQGGQQSEGDFFVNIFSKNLWLKSVFIYFSEISIWSTLSINIYDLWYLNFMIGIYLIPIAMIRNIFVRYKHFHNQSWRMSGIQSLYSPCSTIQGTDLKTIIIFGWLYLSSYNFDEILNSDTKYKITNSVSLKPCKVTLKTIFLI